MKKNIIIILVLSLIIVSCKSKKEQQTDNNSGLIEITKAQFDTEKMEIGSPLIYPFSNVVNFTGSIISSVEGQTFISMPVPGLIQKIYYKPGQFVNKGAVLFEVSGYEFIDLQKDFAESSAILSRMKSDYIRAKELLKDNITTQKDFIYAQSSYLAENAKYKALKIKLESTGLDISKIENGEFYSSFYLKSPIKGFVANINTTIGQYVEPQQRIAEIIDDNGFQLKLSIFEKNISKIKIGQTVMFYLNGNKSEKFKATLNSVGKTISLDSKSIDCYAAIENLKNTNLVNNQFVEGGVYADVDSALAVPKTAIITSENDSYLLVLEKEENTTYYFKKIKVNTGRVNNNYIEVTEQFPANKLLINGAYNIKIE